MCISVALALYTLTAYSTLVNERAYNRRVSILERKDFDSIVQSTFADVEHRGENPARGYSIRMTSGTSSGGPLTICWESKYTAQGVCRGAKRFMLFHGLLTLRLGNVLQMRNVGVEGVRTLVLDPADVSPEVNALLLDFMPDKVYSFPTLEDHIGALIGL